MQTLIVREKAGQCSKGVYLISPTAKEPEMYEIHCASIKQQQSLVEHLRYRIEILTNEAQSLNAVSLPGGVPFWLGASGSPIALRRLGEFSRPAHRPPAPSELIAELAMRDKQLAALCEEKMRLLSELLEALGTNSSKPCAINAIGQQWMDSLESLNYSSLLEQPAADVLQQVAGEAFRLAHNLYAQGCSLSRSVSSVGEHQSNTYVPPGVPKRAETFAGFDAAPRSRESASATAGNITSTSASSSNSALNVPGESANNLVEPTGCSLEILQIEKLSAGALLSATAPPSAADEQWLGGLVSLQHQLNMLLCLFAQVQTNCEYWKAKSRAQEMLQSDSSLSSQGGTSYTKSLDTQAILEELRDRQRQLCAEKQRAANMFSAQWTQLEQKKQAVEQMQNQITQERADLTDQREQLFRQLDALQKQTGICLVQDGANGYTFTGALSSSRPSSSLVQSQQTIHSQQSPLLKQSQKITQPQQQLPLQLACGSSRPRIKPCKSSPNFGPTLTLDVSSRPSSSNFSSRIGEHVRSGSSPSQMSSLPPEDDQKKDDSGDLEIFC